MREGKEQESELPFLLDQPPQVSAHRNQGMLTVREPLDTNGAAGRIQHVHTGSMNVYSIISENLLYV